MCLVHTRAGPNLINGDYLNPQWKSGTKLLKLPKLKLATKGLSKIQGLIPLVIQIGDLQVRTWFGIVQDLPVNETLGTTIIDKCIREYSG